MTNVVPGFSNADDTWYGSFTTSSKTYRAAYHIWTRVFNKFFAFLLSVKREKTINIRVIPESLSSSAAVVSPSVLPSERALIVNRKCKTTCKTNETLFALSYSSEYFFPAANANGHQARVVTRIKKLFDRFSSRPHFSVFHRKLGRWTLLPLTLQI